MSGPTPRPARRGTPSLRTELLFNLAFLAGGALVLAVASAFLATLLLRSDLGSALLAGLIVADLVIFIAFGRYLIHRLVTGPMDALVETTQAVAAGQLARRAAPGGTLEFDRLAASVNRMTERLLDAQGLLGRTEPFHRLSDQIECPRDQARAILSCQADFIVQGVREIGARKSTIRHWPLVRLQDGMHLCESQVKSITSPASGTPRSRRGSPTQSRSTTAPQVSPPPMASSRRSCPLRIRPSSMACDSARGIEAAEVLAWFDTVEITREPSMPSRRATPSRIL